MREKERATIVLLRLDGKGVEAVAEKLKTTAKRVSVWSKRFEEKGLGGLEDKPGRGRRPSIPEAKVAEVITEATRPPASRKGWSVRTMGCHACMSHSTVQRIWAKNERKLHIILHSHLAPNRFG